MADFCYDCTLELFGPDTPNEDLKGLCKEGEIFPVLCEGCGPIYVDHEGKYIYRNPKKVESLKQKYIEASTKFEHSSKTLNDMRVLRNSYHRISSWLRKHQLGEIPFAKKVVNKYDSLCFDIKQQEIEKGEKRRK